MSSFVCLLFVSVCLTVHARDIVLFASSGCYSHDIMMRQVGDEFDRSLSPRFNITWMQIFMYNFGFGQLKRPSHWNSVVLQAANSEETRIIKDGGSLLWETTIPVNPSHPWDYRGAVIFFRILQQNQLNCQDFLHLPAFQHFLQSKHSSLVVVDHFLQECMSMSASLLNTTTVQFSNWPISDGYITSLNIPAPPSSYPKTGTLFSSKKMNEFGYRLANSLFHAFIVVARSLQSVFINHFYAKAGYGHIEMTDVESKHLLYAGRSELLAESVRPISNRIKHFGCAYCTSPSEYIIKQPKTLVQFNMFTHSKPIDSAKTRPPSSKMSKDRTKLLLPKDTKFLSLNYNSSLSCSNKCHKRFIQSGSVSTIKSAVFPDANLRPKVVLNITVLEERYLTTQHNFPELDLNLLEHHKFILVSFGSVAKVEFMPEPLLDIFLTVFGNSSFVILWQTNSPAEVMGKRLNGRAVARNVHLMQWVPIKVLLAHKNLHYTILHGGINTVNEVLMFGVPILGVPLQGDQPSNLQRLVDLGMGQVIDIRGIWRGQLVFKMKIIEQKYELYAQRARKVASMVNMHRKELSSSQPQTTQRFWLRWAERHGQQLKHTKFFHLQYKGVVEHFALLEISSFLSLLTGIVWLLNSGK